MLGQQKSRRQVELLFSRGSVEVWQARWPGIDETADAALEVGGDASRRVVLERRLAANGRLEAEVRATTPVAAALATSIVCPDTTKPVVLMVDGAILSTASPDADGKLAFYDMGNEDDVRVIGALADGDVLPSDFAVTIEP
jgi:hypothetical protein